MKYIVTEDKNGKREIFTFPKSVDHDCMAEMLGHIKNQTGGNWERVRRQPISAGFVTPDNVCYGESYTLNLESWGEKDTELLLEQLKATS